MRWGLVVVGVIGCSRGYEPPRDAPPAVAVTAPVTVDARVQLVRASEVSIEEICVDEFCYPRPKLPPRKDAMRIEVGVQHTIGQELDHIAACANHLRPGYVVTEMEIDAGGIADGVHAQTSLTGTNPDQVRDRCMEKVLARIRWPAQKRTAPVWIVFFFDTKQ